MNVRSPSFPWSAANPALFLLCNIGMFLSYSLFVDFLFCMLVNAHNASIYLVTSSNGAARFHLFSYPTFEGLSHHTSAGRLIT